MVAKKATPVNFKYKANRCYNLLMKQLLKKIFGGLKITWPKLIIFAVIMGFYTSLMAMLVPDGNSFHDIAVLPEWWVLPAIIIIANCKNPLESALKVFVFFLISQPLVYLFQVPFSYMGWGLFGYYRYWFLITLLTFPGGFIGWYIKKDKWYSALILSVMTVYLVFAGISYWPELTSHFPNHLLSVIYCFGIIPVFIFTIFKDKIPRILCSLITVASLLVYLIIGASDKPFEAYNNTFLSENDIVFVGEPYISTFMGEAEGDVKLIKNESGYTIKLFGHAGKKYSFEITDDENTYEFEFHYDDATEAVVIEKK